MASRVNPPLQDPPNDQARGKSEAVTIMSESSGYALLDLKRLLN